MYHKKRSCIDRKRLLHYPRTTILSRKFYQYILMDQEGIVQLYKGIRRIRRFEEEVVLLCQEQALSTSFLSYRNQEAIAVGATSVIEADDFIISSGCCHGLFLARGGAMAQLFSELLGKESGCCGGNAGITNVFDVEHRYIGGWALSATQIPIAAGFAYAQVHHAVPNVTLCFLSNADLANGLFYETAALAKLWEIPLIFIVQNCHQNFTDYQRARPSLLTAAYGNNHENIDGHDIFAVRAAVHTAVTAARENRTATIVEAHTLLSVPKLQEPSKVDPLSILAAKIAVFGKEEAKATADQEIEVEITQAKHLADSAPLKQSEENRGDLT